MNNQRAKSVAAEEVTLTELVSLRHDRRRLIRMSQRESELQGKRVRFSGFLKSSQYHFVQPEQLLGTIQAQVAAANTEGEAFPVWLPNSKEVTRIDVPVGSRINVEATVRIPFLGKIHAEDAVITAG